MRFSTAVAALTVLLAPLVDADWSPSNSAWPSDNAWATETDSITTTYIAETTVTMTLLAVQTQTMHYYSASNTTTASSTYKVPAPKTSIDVSATPSVCADCNLSTGGAGLQSVNVAVAALAGVGALVFGSL